VVLADLPRIVLDSVRELNMNWVAFLLFVNLLLLVAGMFIDPNSILLLFVPTLFPVATALGIDPVHFGLLVTLNICIGMITPPFGLDLFVASGTLQRPVEVVIAGIWRFVLVNLAVLLLVSYVPAISTALPKLLQ
jgi:C4-dicarboxylate transporter DctM subunit